MRGNYVSLLSGLLLVSLLVVSRAGGQDAAKEKAKEEKGTPAAGAVEASGARAAFDANIEKWKQILKDLRKVKLDYQTAGDEDIPKLQEQWAGLIAQGHQMLPALRETGLAAYDEAGGADPQLERFLVKMVTDAVATHELEVAYDLAMKLLAKGCTDKSLYDAAGVAAFCTNQFEDAEKYLKLAKDNGILSPAGGEYLPQISVHKDLWLKEAAIRKQEAEADDLPQVRLTTSKGVIELELFENQAPDTVGNFVHLVEKEFYDGLTFHRVVDSPPVVQGGDPRGDGTGGPGWTIYDELSRDDYRRHFRGSLSMAKQAEPDTGGSQFFLTFRPTPHLDGRHTCFGRITKGLEVLAQLQRMNPEMPTAGAVPDKIVKAEVIRKRDHAYVPKKVEQ
ncbi:MAG TPA: peptidylprolyl isomerase [Pirellulaceae bacterium]|nr:peptidylprolyl isomerase [Pirellulaceae bacterium]